MPFQISLHRRKSSPGRSRAGGSWCKSRHYSPRSISKSGCPANISAHHGGPGPVFPGPYVLCNFSRRAECDDHPPRQRMPVARVQLPDSMGFFSSNKEPKFDPAKDLPDLTGKVVIVTGGNSGIGFATVQHLARKGAKVYLTARNEERAKAALERLNAEGLAPGNGTVVWLELDLSDPRKAKKSAESFLEKETRLDVLVNNAGLMSDTYQKNSDGVIEPMIVNLFSTFVFTRTLVPVLTQTAKEPNSDVRVVFVSSMAMGLLKGKGMRFRNLEDLNEKFSGMLAPMQRYAKSKLAQALVAKQFQRKFDEESVPITVLSLHPGTVYTEGVSKDPNLQMPVIGPLLNFFVRKTFASPSEGAHTSVFAAASPKVKAERDKYKGAFLWPPGKLSEPPVPEFDNTELAEEVWNTVETHLKEWGV